MTCTTLPLLTTPNPERPDVAWIRKRVSVFDVARELGLEVFGRTTARCWRTDNHRNGDANPSLRFHLRKNIARCFVCDQIGGFSNIDLVMGVLNCDFPSAVTWICERFPVPSARRGRPLAQRASWPQHYRVGVTASEFELLVRSGLWAQLSPTQRTILPVLFAFQDSDTGLTTISYRGLMRFAGVGSPKSIALAVWRLQSLHVLKVERTAGAGVVRGCSSYRLTLDDPELIRLLNHIHRRQQAEIERERAFRAQLRTSRRNGQRDPRNPRSRMKIRAPAPGPILHVDFLCVENQLQRQSPNLSCTGELLCSPSEVQTNKSVHLVKRGEEERQEAGIL